MQQENCQKIKLLKLLELLRMETDESNPIKTISLCERLAQMGISCDRRTLSRDIELLNRIGYEVMSCRIGREKAYYVEERSFNVPELKILIDAVQAANFITSRKSSELISKIAALGGSHQAEILTENMVIFNTRKHSNERIFYNIDCLEKALRQKKKVSFYYFDLDENGCKAYRKEKQRYITEPVALIFYEDNYYLMCYSSKYGTKCNYRVDRMENVEIELEEISKAAQSIDVSDYTKQAFKMFNGKCISVVLEFDKALIGSIYDKFGENIKIKKTGGENFSAEVSIIVSPVFWGWIFQFAGRMRIATPTWLNEKLIDMAEMIVDKENDNKKDSRIKQES